MRRSGVRLPKATPGQSLIRESSPARGNPGAEIETLPSASLRVRVYAGIDPVTRKRHHLTEIIPAGPRAVRGSGELARCRAHCKGRPFVQHRTDDAHDCNERCKPHVCRPPAAASLLKFQAILNKAGKRAVRWEWIGRNPFELAEPIPVTLRPAIMTY